MLPCCDIHMVSIQVFDERGHDVTPLPLIDPDSQMQGRKMTNMLESSNTVC